LIRAAVGRALRLSLLLASLLFFSSPPTLAVERAILTDNNLTPNNIRFVSLSGSTIKFFDNKRRLQEAPLNDYIHLAWTTPDTTPTSPALSASPLTLRLADGHILPGAFNGIDDQGRILWKTERLGAVPIELDSLLSFNAIQLPSRDPDAPQQIFDSADDIITLANGDKMAGFVDSLTPEALILQINGQSIPLTWDRVGAVQLANPPQKEAGVWLRLADQTQIRVERLAMNRKTATGRAFGDLKVEIPADAIASIDFNENFRLVPLSELSYEIESGASVFAVDTPPHASTNAAGQTVVHLHAPIAVRYEVPRGATRFAARAWLDKQDLQWAHLILAVADGQGEHTRQTLGPDQPETQLNIPLRDRDLLIQLEEGLNGPIRDRLRLSNAAVLVPVE
jgi:hypothetical protein